jgi:hypothetical protein
MVNRHETVTAMHTVSRHESVTAMRMATIGETPSA